MTSTTSLAAWAQPSTPREPIGPAVRMRPVYHWAPGRIEAHIKLCGMARLLEGIAEIRGGDTWRNLVARLDAIKVVEYERAGAQPNAGALRLERGGVRLGEVNPVNRVSVVIPGCRSNPNSIRRPFGPRAVELALRHRLSIR